MAVTDPLATAVREAQAAHAALLGSGDARAICAAYIRALETERALLIDCGGPADLVTARELEFMIDDERAALATLEASS